MNRKTFLLSLFAPLLAPFVKKKPARLDLVWVEGVEYHINFDEIKNAMDAEFNRGPRLRSFGPGESFKI